MRRHVRHVGMLMAVCGALGPTAAVGGLAQVQCGAEQTQTFALDASLGAPAAIGDILVAYVDYSLVSDGGVTAVVDNAGESFDALPAITVPGAEFSTQLWYVAVADAGARTATASLSSQAFEGAVLLYDFDGMAGFRVTAFSQDAGLGVGATLSTGSLVAAPPAVLLAFVGAGATTDFGAVGAPFTTSLECFSDSSAYDVPTGPGTYSATFSAAAASTGTWTSSLVALGPVASAADAGASDAGGATAQPVADLGCGCSTVCSPWALLAALCLAASRARPRSAASATSNGANTLDVAEAPCDLWPTIRPATVRRKIAAASLRAS